MGAQQNILFVRTNKLIKTNSRKHTLEKNEWVCFEVKHEFEFERILSTIQICKIYCSYIWHLTNPVKKNLKHGIQVHFREMLEMGNVRHVT